MKSEVRLLLSDCPEMKRKGIAKHLLEYVCQDAVESGFDYVEVYPWKETVDERTFFMGFVGYVSEFWI